MKIPFPLVADAYSISSEAFASEKAKQHSVYNFTNRYGAKKGFPDLAKDNRMVFFGINHFISNYLTTPITLEDVLEAENFLATAHSFGGPLYFPKELWLRVLYEHDGYLPLKITALHEGRTFYPNEPPIVVKATDGFGELAAHIEARLVGAISIGTAVATKCRHWLERMRDEVKEDLKLLGRDTSLASIDQIARWQIHNFGSRACSSSEESVLTGMAHLLSFHGTDNFDAAYLARKSGAQHPTGTSILALAHRNVLGHGGDEAAINAIVNADLGNFKIASCVADTFNYYDAIPKLVQIAMKNPDKCYVGRPDSGDCHSVIGHIFDTAREFNHVKYENSFALPKNTRYIYGDSANPTKQLAVMRDLRKEGMLPTLWGIWGVGGDIRNSSTRDTLSSSYKLACIGDYCDPMVKLSESETKLSVPFETSLVEKFPRVRISTTLDGCNIRNRIDRVYYDHGEYYPTTFAKAQKHAIEDFDLLQIMPNEFGDSREDVLCRDIIEEQNRVFKLHRDR